MDQQNEDKKDFAGKNGFIWWIGVVEDRQDPLKLGRCRVRCVGWHAEDKMRLPTDALPWAMPSYPANHTQTYAPKEGDMAFGFFVDGENAQEPVIMGIFPNIPLKAANIQEAFSDPRPKEELLNTPRTPRFKRYNTDGSGIQITERENANNYPINLDEPTTSRLARNDEIKTEVFLDEIGSDNDNSIRPHTSNTFVKQFNETYVLDVKDKKFTSNNFIEERKINANVTVPTFNSSWKEPETKYAAKYPYNNVMETESGHIQEFDDTPGAERIHTAHRNGSFVEFYPDGDKVTKVTKDNYTIIMKDEHVYIMGKCNITVQGDAEVYVQKDAYVKVDGNVEVRVGGNYNEIVQGTYSVRSYGNMQFDAPRIDLN